MAFTCSNLRSISNLIKFKSAHLSSLSFLSTKTALELRDPLQEFKTTEDNPVHHTNDHVGKYYTIPQDLKGKLYFSGGIPKSLDIQMKTFCENCLMVREPALEILSLMKKVNYSSPAVRFVLYGKNGTGKTSSMVHVLHYAHESKYLLVHLPWVSNWTKRPKEIVASQYNESLIDLPVESAIWLQHFKLQNSQLMEELNIRSSKSYTWSKREVTEEGDSLMDIVEHGIQRVRHSSDCVAVLLKEIKHHSQFGKFKVLVMVDGVNAIWSKTNVKRPDRTLVQAKDITIVKAFIKMLDNDWNNAVVVASVDTVPFDRNAGIKGPYKPLELLGKEGFELLSPFIPIETVNYTDKELQSVLDYYCDRRWIQSQEAQSDFGRKQIKFLSGCNPFEVMKVCNPL